MAYLEITRFDYLRTPVCSWIFFNDAGGSFTNSGQHRSIKRAAAHFYHLYRDQFDTTTKVVVKRITGFDSQDVPFFELDPPTTLATLL